MALLCLRWRKNKKISICVHNNGDGGGLKEDTKKGQDIFLWNPRRDFLYGHGDDISSKNSNRLRRYDEVGTRALATEHRGYTMGEHQKLACSVSF